MLYLLKHSNTAFSNTFLNGNFLSLPHSSSAPLLHPIHLFSTLLLSYPHLTDFEQADFKQGIVSMSDLHEGMLLTGRVENTALFGAFVDIGVGRSGLIPKRYISLDKLPVDKRRRSLALGPGERVEVRIIDVDLQRKRITLDLIRVLR